MRMPELKSLTRDRGLRNYSHMRKAELVAFLTIWVRIISTVWGQRASDKLVRYLNLLWGILPIATFYLF